MAETAVKNCSRVLEIAFAFASASAVDIKSSQRNSPLQGATRCSAGERSWGAGEGGREGGEEHRAGKKLHARG
jgi:hypothetical protein